ncbi:MAG: ornithine cyclodeaminase family protein [Deltaproteobacteria bacterium]|nr:ornithine cyclodeaminase family protein [Deltaproteobacteria bacterium]
MARGDAIRRPRVDNLIPTNRPDEFFSFSSMEGGMREPGYYALRIKPDIISWPMINGMRRRVTYCSEPGLYGGLVLLFSVANAELLAVMNDGFVQHLRVAATAAIGAKYLARPGAKVLAMIGSGGMARSFAKAFCAVRDIGAVKVYSPTRANLKKYAAEMAEALECDVVPVDSPQEALRGAHIVAACTNSYSPVIQGEWLEPGVHIANVMASELSADAYRRIDTVGLLVRRTPPSVAGFVDDDFALRVNTMCYLAGQPHERAKVPHGGARSEINKGEERYPNARYVDCVNWEKGERYQRARDGEITTLATQSFGTLEGDIGASSGIQGIQFASVGGRIFENARRLGLGQELPKEMFLQDIPT